MTGLRPASGATVSLLGTERVLEWEAVGTGFVARVPEGMRASPPCDYGWVLKLSTVEH